MNDAPLNGPDLQQADAGNVPQPIAAPTREVLIDAIRTVYDPEIPVNIYELGLIYDLDIAADGGIHVRMTLTAPGCPVAGTMPGMVESAIKQVPGVGEVAVELVWDPPWNPSMMSEVAKLELNMF